MTAKDKYNFSFIAGALLLSESQEYIGSISDFDAYLNDTEQVDYMVLSTNSESSRKRLKSELDKRIRTLNKSYLTAFTEMTADEQRIILFLAVCKTYKIIQEFCLEVVYNKWKMFDNELSTYDFQYFVSLKISDEHLASLTDQTQYKVSQVALRILKDVGILKDNTITQPYLSDGVRQLIEDNGDAWFFHCILHPNA